MAEHFSDVVLQLPIEDLPTDFSALPFAVTENQGVADILSHDVNTTIEQLIQQGINLAHLQIRNRTLEDLFLEITGKELRH